MTVDPKMPVFPIGSVARILGCSAKVLRDYEKSGLVRPARSEGQHRLYSQEDVEMLSLVHGLSSEARINMAGIRLLLGLWDHLDEPGREKLRALPRHLRATQMEPGSRGPRSGGGGEEDGEGGVEGKDAVEGKGWRVE